MIIRNGDRILNIDYSDLDLFSSSKIFSLLKLRILSFRLRLFRVYYEQIVLPFNHSQISWYGFQRTSPILLCTSLSSQIGLHQPQSFPLPTTQFLKHKILLIVPLIKQKGRAVKPYDPYINQRHDPNVKIIEIQNDNAYSPTCSTSNRLFIQAISSPLS